MTQVTVQQLPYLGPRKERAKPPRPRKPRKAARITHMTVKQLAERAYLFGLCKAHGVPDCNGNVPLWKMRRYLRQKGVKTD